MARLFPSKPAGTISPETAKVLHALRRAPGDDLLIWIRMPVSCDWRPELMVIHRDEGCHLISVSALTEARVESTLQGDLFAAPADAISPADFALAERTRLAAYRDEVLCEAGFELREAPSIRAVIAFPNVPQALLDELAHRGAIAGCKFWGRETIRTEPMLRRIAAAGADQRRLPDGVLDCLRRKFSPEIVIPEQLVARLEETPSRDLSAKLSGCLLDLDQEWLAKEDLALSEEADAALREPRLRLVTGVAGSGKTLILLYRAMLQTRLQPDARVLILTHNRPLTGELRDRFRRLCPGSELKWQTFFQWCREISGAHWRKIIAPWERETLLRELAGKHVALARLPLTFLADELDWIRDQGVAPDDYLAAPRLGRKRPLHEEQRRNILVLLGEYETALAKRRLHDWPGAAAAAAKLAQNGTIAPPRYDFVFLDEAQFFAPSWFALVRRSMCPARTQLFLAADPTQGFLKRRQSWLASGLEVRGHSARLTRAYRNTREILGFAARFYRSRLPADDEEINLPESSEIARLPSGNAPQFIQIGSPQDERARVANEITVAIDAGSRPEHFLVLHAEDAAVEPFIETINRIAHHPLARNLKELTTSAANCVRVSSLNAATGLESPIVFLCGLDVLLEKEDALGLHADERDELTRDNTRRIYMAITRAAQKLFITHRRPLTRAVLECSSKTSTTGSSRPELKTAAGDSTRALEAGATSLREPADQLYGDRSDGVKDACGNQWWIATHKEDLSPAETAME